MKRSQHRLPMTLDRMAYPSDLSDEQWERVESLVPTISSDAAYAVHTRREIINGILFVLRSGCPWRLLPHEFPAWGDRLFEVDPLLEGTQTWKFES